MALGADCNLRNQLLLQCRTSVTLFVAFPLHPEQHPVPKHTSCTIAGHSLPTYVCDVVSTRFPLQDIARLTLAALRNDACNRRTLTLAGPAAYTTKEVIEKCENLSDSRAQVSTVPTWLLKGTRGVLRGADWAKDAADRLVSGVLVAAVLHTCPCFSAATYVQSLWMVTDAWCELQRRVLDMMQHALQAAFMHLTSQCMQPLTQLLLLLLLPLAPARHLRRCWRAMRRGPPPWRRRMRCWAWTPPPSQAWMTTCRWVDECILNGM